MKYERLTLKGCKECVTHGNCKDCDLCHIDNWEALDRLAELEDKIENGTLVELPCKVGDTVYQLKGYDDGSGEMWHLDPHIVECVVLNTDGIIEIFDDADEELELDTIYPTREQAEAKLKELEGK